MNSKTIKIGEENYRWLVQISGEMQKEIGRPVSIDYALRRMHTKSISELAGRWKISDKENKSIRDNLAKGWKKWKISA